MSPEEDSHNGNKLNEKAGKVRATLVYNQSSLQKFKSEQREVIRIKEQPQKISGEENVARLHKFELKYCF